MTFWSGETLSIKLPSLISDFKPDSIECAAYELTIGPEIFVTSDHSTDDPKTGVKTQLGEGEPFKIPPGQFAFLLTEERVAVPEGSIAFISIKATQKFLGLVNVSGFHVDPGWDGHLKFSVYNAGPAPIHLHQGKKMFLIWYAQLDQLSAHTYNNSPEKGEKSIPDKMLNNMAGQVFSPMILAKEVKEQRDKLNGLSSQFQLMKWVTLVVGGLLISLFLKGSLTKTDTRQESPEIGEVSEVQQSKELEPTTDAGHQPKIESDSEETPISSTE